jgi:hypothetical protein
MPTPITVGDWMIIISAIYFVGIAAPLWVLVFTAVLTYRHNLNRHSEAKDLRASKEFEQRARRIRKQREIGNNIIAFLKDFRIQNKLQGLKFEMSNDDVCTISLFWNATKIHEVRIDLSDIGREIKLSYPLRPRRPEGWFSDSQNGWEFFLAAIRESLSELEKTPA